MSAMNRSKESSLFTLVSDYMDAVIPQDSTMKVLLIDAFTLHIISTSFSQTQLLQKGVFLVDQVSGNRQRNKVKNLRCIIFIRPENSSVDAACSELRLAKYSGYTIIFCGVASPEHLDRLAMADVEALVSDVQEVFCDFCTVNKDAFVIENTSDEAGGNQPGDIVVRGSSPYLRAPSHMLLSSSVSNNMVKRLAEGIAAMFVAQRRRPHIRYTHRSAYASRVAKQLMTILKNDPDLYNYRPKDTVLLLLDRAEDPVTPLLTPWTYQAMLHEHIGLRYNTLRLPPDVAGADAEGYAFSEQDDIFFAANMFLNWGDLCNNVKTYVDKCKTALNLDRSTATMDEIKQFMQRISQTKSLTNSVAKHTTVTTHLSHVIKERGLLQVSLLEQDMVASHNANDHWNRLLTLLQQPEVTGKDKVRLCVLYYLRYEMDAGSAVPRAQALLNNLMPAGHTPLLQRMRDYFTPLGRPTDDLFAETGVLSSIVKTFVDVGNIYTQHEPVLRRTLLQTLSGNLEGREGNAYSCPYCTPNPPSFGFKPTEVMVFMCGGYTYEEAALVHGINHKTVYKPNELAQISPNAHVVLGGDRVLNSNIFMEALSEGL